MSRKHPKPSLSPEALTIAWQSASLLLGYPDEELLGQLPVIRSASHRLPAAVGEPIREFVVHLESTPLVDLQADYVETFDTRRRCNLFLTYFAHGDTRKRGVALLRFKQTYLRSGFVLDDSELPDHLCVVLEAVTGTLPPLRGEEHEAVRKLAAEGPPEEEVGLAPFATPQFSGDSGTSELPMPTFPGAHA